MVGRNVTALTVCLLGFAPPRVQAGEPPARDLDVGRVAWSELRFSAHKMGLSATIQVRLDDLAARLAGPGDGGVQGADPATRPRLDDLFLESTTHLPGRIFIARERVDPVQARVRQIVDTETGARNHRKTYTPTGHGFLLDLLVPASAPESLLSPERWTQQTRSFTAYPRTLPPETAITGPVGLLYAASAAGLAAPGDAFTVHVLVQTQVERVTVQVEGVEPVALDYQSSSGGTTSGVREEVSALRLVARSKPVDPSSPSAFRIFGLEGDVQILWDASRRLPVAIAGNVKVLGRVQVRLASVTLR